MRELQTAVFKTKFIIGFAVEARIEKKREKYMEILKLNLSFLAICITLRWKKNARYKHVFV